MADQRGSLRQDFRIFLDPGFLVALIIILVLSAVGAAIMVYADNRYGIPLSGYWK